MSVYNNSFCIDDESFENQKLLNDLGIFDGPNTFVSRANLIRFTHFNYLLFRTGDKSVQMDKVRFYLNLADEKVQKAKKSENKRLEIAQINLIDEHIHALEKAEYYYEKASKILCQMIITLMDYILQAKNQISVIYKNKDRQNYLNLVDEMNTLVYNFEECYYFLCVFDFCTDKIADFMQMKDYKNISNEHLKIALNELPIKVMQTLEVFNRICSDQVLEINVFSALNGGIYHDGFISKCYDEIIAQEYCDEIDAMNHFCELVEKVHSLYVVVYAELGGKNE